jgi:hypothetical protein
LGAATSAIRALTPRAKRAICLNDSAGSAHARAAALAIAAPRRTSCAAGMAAVAVPFGRTGRCAARSESARRACVNASNNAFAPTPSITA